MGFCGVNPTVQIRLGRGKGYLTDDIIKEQTITVEAGGTKEITAPFVLTKVGTGEYTVTVNVNPNIAIPEKDFRNNVAYKTIILPEDFAVDPKGKQIVTFGRIKQSVLFQNYPNPFNPETWIPYYLSESVEVTIRIHDAMGSLVRTLALGRKPSGLYVSKEKAAYWDGKNDAGEYVSSGVYFYEFAAGDFRSVKKMVILR